MRNMAHHCTLKELHYTPGNRVEDNEEEEGASCREARSLSEQRRSGTSPRPWTDNKSAS